MSPAKRIDGASHMVVSEKSQSRRIPASGSAALAASALIQAALGVEFFLSGLNKFADPNYVRNFRLFVDASPGTHTGLLAPLIHAIVQPNIAFFAELTKFVEFSLGIVLLLGAIEVGRRRLSGRIAAQHGYEAPVALVAALAGLAAAGLSLSISLLMGQQLPTITPGRALTTAIPVELLLVPLGIAVAWVEFGRFLVLARPSASVAVPGTRGRLPNQADEATITGGSRTGPLNPSQIQSMDVWLEHDAEDDRLT